MLYDTRYLAGDDPWAIGAILKDAGLTSGGIAPGTAYRIPPLDRLVRKKRQLYRRMIGKGLRVDRSVADLVRELSRRVPLAIVSGAAGSEIATALRGARLARHFRVVVAAESVRRPKPHPEGYRLALHRLRDLGVPRRGCLAVEDSPAGIAAARRAGLTVIGVATSVTARRLRAAGAVKVAATLAALSADEILRC